MAQQLRLRLFLGCSVSVRGAGAVPVYPCGVLRSLHVFSLHGLCGGLGAAAQLIRKVAASVGRASVSEAKTESLFIVQA